MSKKRILLCIVVACFAILCNIGICLYMPDCGEKQIQVNITVTSNTENAMEIFYLSDSQGDTFMAEQSQKLEYKNVGKKQILSYSVPAKTNLLRLDFGAGESVNEVKSVEIIYGKTHRMLSPAEYKNIIDSQDVKTDKLKDSLQVESLSYDPYIVWNVKTWGLEKIVVEESLVTRIIAKVVLCVIIDLILFVFIKHCKRLLKLPIEIFENRKLIFSLAKNDFKTKFAGSYLGIFWAFVQPIVTVLVYWFVFEKGLHASGINTKAGITAPFVLWLIAGLVPWFFFQDALNGGTNALLEYSYLVKKVVFKISILPIVKIISALFVHLFFIIFTLVLYSCYSYYPDLYTLQIIYYSFCMFIYVLAVSYATSAIVAFFRDLSQVINIVLQVGVWMTPIMWNIDAMELSPFLILIFKANPMYYIVAGYRDALINKVWFWEHPELSLFFWLNTIIVAGIGMVIFKRLKVHFADVL